MSISKIEEKITEKGLWANSEIPTSWAWVNFETLFKNISDSNKKLQQKAYQPYGKYPVVDQGKSLTSGYINDENLLHPQEPPYIVFGDHTRCVKYVNFKFVQGADGIKTLTVFPCSNIKYAFWALQAIKLPNKGYSRHFQFLKNSDFPLAPLNEQKRVVAKIEELFSKLDAGIAALERVQANLKRYRAAVLKAAVEGKLTEEWRKQKPNTEPASKLLQRILKERRQKWESEQLEKYQKSGKTPSKDWQSKYKESSTSDTANLPSLPDGWCWATVEQVGNVQLGRQRSPQKISLNYPTKYIRAANLTEDGLKLDDVLDMEFLPNEQEIYRLYDGDVLVSEASGSPDQVGKPVIWKDEIENCCFQNTVIRLSPWVVSSKYLLVIFQDFYFNKVFARASGGVGINHLSAGKFSQLPIPLAPLSEQEEISNIVEFQLSLHKQTKQQLEKDIIRSARLRQSILKQAFSGKLVPQDPNDEPASLLLQRIQAEKANTIKAKPAKRQRQKVTDENSANIDPLG